MGAGAATVVGGKLGKQDIQSQLIYICTNLNKPLLTKNDSERSSEKQKCSHEIQKITSLKYHLGPNFHNKGLMPFFDFLSGFHNKWEKPVFPEEFHEFHDYNFVFPNFVLNRFSLAMFYHCVQI